MTNNESHNHTSDYGPEDDTWDPRSNIHPVEINAFLKQNDVYDYQWPGARCPHCDKPCASEHGVKIHARHCQYKPDPQNFMGTRADLKVRDGKRAEAQQTKPKVNCEGEELKNVWQFKYLGALFAASGEQRQDVDRRIALAMSRCGELRQVFSSDTIPQNLKIEIYKSAVSSLLTYGCEAWHLDKRTQARINGANARCMARITGKDAHTEASKATRTYDLVQAIRRRRYIWLGHILRMKDARLVKIAVKAQFERGKQGNIFMDAPQQASFEELEEMAADRAAWTAHWDRRFPDTGKRTKPIKKRKPQKKKPKAKSKGLTDAQRAAWAHAHYIIHHGTAADATRFLKYPQTVANTPPEALNEVRVLARVSLDASAPARKPKMSMPTKTSANSTTAPTTLTSVPEKIATTVAHGMDITPTAKSVTSSTTTAAAPQHDAEAAVTTKHTASPAHYPAPQMRSKCVCTGCDQYVFTATIEMSQSTLQQQPIPPVYIKSKYRCMGCSGIHPWGLTTTTANK